MRAFEEVLIVGLGREEKGGRFGADDCCNPTMSVRTIQAKVEENKVIID